ncbi:hypothetical protein GA0115240_16703 [Streptomyces sp. DvalAA-14]|nr:hypothetical protein GA0115240_16703 [Streptomyces sp. DvalAA-14]
MGLPGCLTAVVDGNVGGRVLPLPDWDTLDRLATALVARSAGEYPGWGDVVHFEACTATRIGEVSGVRVQDINREEWTWQVCRQSTPGPGGLTDKGRESGLAPPRPRCPDVTCYPVMPHCCERRCPQCRLRLTADS